ncbi:MAG: histidine phosphatase family protein [Euryarchaeota archaeon]|nr:histidine phosphatase family protein [Euryarchaeota archaeon]
MRPDAPLQRVLLVRHGETDWNREGRCLGWTDRPLTDEGHTQARTLAERLKVEPVLHVVSSPLARAHATAERIAAHHSHVTIETDPRLREIHHGALEGVFFHELPKHAPEQHHAWVHRPSALWMPEGERLSELQERAVAAFSDAVKRFDDDPHDPERHLLVVVAHNLTIGTILCDITGRSLDSLKDFRLDHCGFHELARNGDDWALIGSQGAAPFDPLEERDRPAAEAESDPSV